MRTAWLLVVLAGLLETGFAISLKASEGFSKWLPTVSFAVCAVASFALLFVVQTVVRVAPHGRLARWLYPRAFAGFYLDEIFTRLTFALWPPRIAPVAPARIAAIAVERT